VSTPIRAVLFDAVGTLIHPDPPVAEVYFGAGRKFGSKLEREDIAGRFQRAFQVEEQADRFPLPPTTEGPALQRRPTSEHRERQRWRGIVESVFSDVTGDDGQLFATLWEHFAVSSNWRAFADVPTTMMQLEQQGLTLGIASNFDRRLLSISEGLPPLAACTNVFCSSLIGYPKPSPEFFRAVEHELKLSPGEILLVGDDWENDHEGATAAGWQAIHLDRSSARDDATSVNSLLDVVELLQTSKRE